MTTSMKLRDMKLPPGYNACLLLDAAAEIDRLTRERDEARAEFQEADTLNRRIVDLLTRTANALRGDPPPLTLWSWHDLPEHAAALRAERDALAKALAELVACKDLKIAGLRSPEEEDEYFRRKPAAWDTARAALAQAKEQEA